MKDPTKLSGPRRGNHPESFPSILQTQGLKLLTVAVALSMVASEQEALEEIEDAIDRIFDGTFGVCQETGKPIKKTRLKVVPFTRFSLEGQNLFEQRKRREGDTVTGAFATISDSTMGQED